jgi:hypothetical protein
MKRLLGIGAAICALLAGGADAAFVRIDNLVLSADGGFTPRQLPRKAYAPIEFVGRADLRAVNGSVPPAVEQIVVDFDRDGRLSTGGLPVCQPVQLEDVTPQEARARCRGAIVGTGHVEAVVVPEGGGPVPVGSELTLFNGPRLEGNPTVLLHARTTEPAPQNFAITIPIERRRGEFRYRAIVDVPPIAGGRGALTHVDARVGRRYRYRGSKRSYTSARCSDNVLRTHGRFTFADGTIIDGSIDKGCTVRP